MAIGAEENDEAVFVGHPAVCRAEKTMMQCRVASAAAYVANAGVGLEYGFYLAFSHRLSISAISFGVLVSMPCSLHSSMMRSRRRDIWAVS